MFFQIFMCISFVERVQLLSDFFISSVYMLHRYSLTESNVESNYSHLI